MTSYDELKELFEKRDKLDLFEKKVEETCLVVMRQTNYDKEKALEKLKQHNMAALDVVKEYMGIPLKHEKKAVTTNQAVFREFRTFLDEACNNYQRQKEIKEQRELQRRIYIQRLAAMQKEKEKLETIKED